MAKRTSKKPPRQWRVIEKVIKKNAIEIKEGSGSRKKLTKQTEGGRLRTTIHIHNRGSEIAPVYIDQIIDKFGKDESEFYG